MKNNLKIRSLVSTNEHLLQEINLQKQFSKSGTGRLAISNEVDLYSAASYPDSLVPQLFLPAQDPQCMQSKSLIRKQFEQISNATNGNGTNTRYSYSVVK